MNVIANHIQRDRSRAQIDDFGLNAFIDQRLDFRRDNRRAMFCRPDDMMVKLVKRMGHKGMVNKSYGYLGRSPIWVAHGKDIANTLWLPWALTDMGRPWMNRMGSGNIMGNLMNEVLPLTRFSGFL